MRTLKGLLLEMKLGETVDERILAEEMIVNMYEDLQLKADALAEALEQIADYFCACSIDDEIIPQVVAREALKAYKEKA
jgi:hypothetical protein